jgi:ABC-type lipoprotein export system ATPase subunit
MGDVVRASGLVKAYGAGAARRRVLDGADLEVAAGELVAVVGPSGSGKSTLLHVLGGLDRLDAGTIEVAGTPVHRLGERALTRLRRDQIGLVFQAFHLVPELTGAENVVLPARANGGGAAGAARARALIERLGLAEAAGRRPAELSGGEQQRLAIARALVNEPALVLADEPTGNLDDESGAGVLALLRSVAAGGRAVVLVTHDPRAGAVADRTLRLVEGRLQAVPRA